MSNWSDGVKHWEPLGEVAPAALVDARLALHWVAQAGSAAGTTLATPASDASHTSFEWNDELRALLGVEVGAPRLRVGVRPADLALLVVDRGAIVAEMRPVGATLDAAVDWVGRELAARGAATPGPRLQ